MGIRTTQLVSGRGDSCCCYICSPLCRVLTIMHLKQTMFLGYFTTYTTLPPCLKSCRVGNIQRWCVKMTSVSSFTAPCFVPFDGYGSRYARQSPFIWVNRSLNLDSRTVWPDLDYYFSFRQNSANDFRKFSVLFLSEHLPSCTFWITVHKRNKTAWLYRNSCGCVLLENRVSVMPKTEIHSWPFWAVLTPWRVTVN